MPVSYTLARWKAENAFKCLRPAGHIAGVVAYVDATREAPFFTPQQDVILLPATASVIEVRSFEELLDAGRAPGVDRWNFARAAEVFAAEVR